MFKNRTIFSEIANIEISALDTAEGMVMMSIEFKDLNDKEYPNQTLVWDNGDWIKVQFLDFLKRWREKTLVSTDIETFEEIWDILNDDLIEELIEMVEESIKLGWN